MSFDHSVKASHGVVTISPIAAGFITLKEQFFVSPADPQAARQVPSLSFLIRHQSPPQPTSCSKPFYLLFDLGLRSSLNRYPEPTQNHLKTRAPYVLPEGGFPKLLEEQGLGTDDVDLVILSHVHYDHHGDPEDFKQHTQFAVGSGAMRVLKEGLGGIASHQHFEADLLPKDRSWELPRPAEGGDTYEDAQAPWFTSLSWQTLGPFSHAIDLFGDGSVHVVDAPGHLPGHVNLLCHVGPRHWVYLAGDTCHDPRLLTGEKDIGEWTSDNGNRLCIHIDKEQAKESIERIRQLQRIFAEAGDRLEIILAHDDGWLAANKSRCWPNSL